MNRPLGNAIAPFDADGPILFFYVLAVSRHFSYASSQQPFSVVMLHFWLFLILHCIAPLYCWTHVLQGLLWLMDRCLMFFTGNKGWCHLFHHLADVFLPGISDF